MALYKGKVLCKKVLYKTCCMEVIKRLQKVNVFRSCHKLFYQGILSNILHTVSSKMSCSKSAIQMPRYSSCLLPLLLWTKIIVNEIKRNKRIVGVRGSAVGNNLVSPYHTGPKWRYFFLTRC